MTTSTLIRAVAATVVLAVFDAASALVVGGVILSVFLSRRVDGSWFLEAVLLVSYVLRVVLAISLYAISAHQLPILQDLQLDDGFWRFALDAPWYHWNAVRIAEAFRWGTEIPQLMVYGKPFVVPLDFYLFVAFIYRILGAHPLYIPLLNATIWSAISILVYLLARRMKGQDAGRIAVFLVSFWPSPYVWSSQILKDTLVIFLLLSVLFLCILILEQRHRLWFAAIVLLVPIAILLTRLRFYLLPIVVLAIGGAVVVTLVMSSPHWQWGKAVRGLVLVGILLTSSVLARSVDPVALFSPSRPDLGHLRKARDLEQQGDHAAAAKEHQHALALNPGLAKAPLRTPKEVPQPESRPSEPFLKRVTRKNIHFLFQMFSLSQIAVVRRGFAGQGGASNAGEDVKLDDFWSMVAFLPRGLSYALFAPFPWDWLWQEGDTGLFRLLSGIEVMLIFAMTPFLLVSIGRAARFGRLDAWLLLVFSAVTVILLGLAVTNIGILFRLRLQFLIPMFVILAAYGVGDRWRVVYDLLDHRFFRQPDRDAVLDLILRTHEQRRKEPR